MTFLILGIFLFLGIHSISIFALGVRNQLAARSEIGWKAVYAIISLIGMMLIVQGYAQARLNPTYLYVTPLWLRHLSALLMSPVFVLFVAPYFPGKISTVIKQPQLVAVQLWAVSHLLVNGTVADMILFGSFLAWAVADKISMKNRAYRPVPGLPKSSKNDLIIIVLGLSLFGAFAFHLHQVLIGIPVAMVS